MLQSENMLLADSKPF